MAAISTDFVIRRAWPEEAAVLTDLVLRSKASNGYDAAFMEACADELAVTAKVLREQTIWVAEEGGRLLGCASLSVGDGFGEVHRFFVAPEAKRRGVGSALWTHLLGEAEAAGVARLTLDADPEAVPFYQAMGFVVTGEVPSGSIPGRFLPRMERPV